MNKNIAFNGYTAVPSDYICPDGDLAVSMNLINEDGGVRPILPGVTKMQLPNGYNVVHIHKTSAFTHYIIRNGQNLYWLDEGDVDPEEVITPTQLLGEFANINDISTIGNTIVVLAGDGMHYILWDKTKNDNAGGYEYLGQQPPFTEITFGLESEVVAFPGKVGETIQKPVTIKNTVETKKVPLPIYAYSNSWVPPRIEEQSRSGSTFTDFDFSLEGMSGEEGTASVDAEVSKITQYALAAVNKLVAQEATDKERFMFPFLVRYAYELYDGSLIMHSYPCLMIPNSRGPIFGLNSKVDTQGDTGGFELDGEDDGKMRYTFRGRAYALASELKYSMTPGQDLSKWKDVTIGINVYITPPIYTYDQAGKVYGWKCMDGVNNTDYSAWDTYYTVSKCGENGSYLNQKFATLFASSADAQEIFQGYSTYYKVPSYILSIPEKTEEQMTNDMLSASYYKIASFRFDEISATSGDTTLPITKGSLASLVARQTMDDDYQSHDILAPKYSFTYNSRMNIANVVRTQHAPLPPHVEWAKEQATGVTHWQIGVKLENGIVASAYDSCQTSYPSFVYYPDAEAQEVYLRKMPYAIPSTGDTLFRAKLQRHPFLYGAYWFRGFWTQEDMEVVSSSEHIPLPEGKATTAIEERGKLYTSDVNNPFHFPVLGINTIGTGEILGISAAVKAMSQGQFGEFPLYAFTTDGVWALGVASDGSYSAKQPATRDVCINPKSITQIDTAVLFMTDRGIMLIQGSDTMCISDIINDMGAFSIADLSGLSNIQNSAIQAAENLPCDFKAYAHDAEMIYDYTHQRIVVFNPTYNHALVYSLKSKMWGMMESNIESGINSYPDAYAMTSNGKMIDLSHDVEQSIEGLLVTRPLKIDAPDVMKTIRTIIARGHYDYAGKTICPIKTILYGSRDLFNWQLVWSSNSQYLRGFSGTPYKYFRIALLTDLQKHESVTGCSIDYTLKATDVLR